MAPFSHEYCPICLANTTQHWLQNESGELSVICESCQTVLIHRNDGSVGQRAATNEERAAVPPKIDTSVEPWVSMFAELRKGKAELRTWVQAGCLGLTPELEAAMPAGARERFQRFVELPDATDSERHAEPGAAADRGRDEGFASDEVYPRGPGS